MAAIEGDARRIRIDRHGVLYRSIVSAEGGDGTVIMIRDPNFSAVESRMAATATTKHEHDNRYRSLYYRTAFAGRFP